MRAGVRAWTIHGEIPAHGQIALPVKPAAVPSAQRGRGPERSAAPPVPAPHLARAWVPLPRARHPAAARTPLCGGATLSPRKPLCISHKIHN